MSTTKLESVEFLSFKRTKEERVYECSKCGGEDKIC